MDSLRYVRKPYLLDAICSFYEDAIEFGTFELLEHEETLLTNAISHYYDENGWDATAEWLNENGYEIIVACVEMNLELKFSRKPVQLEMF